MKKAQYDVVIQPADNGIVVQIGCKRMVFKEADLPEFLADLSEFLTGGFEADRKLSAKYFGTPKPGEVNCATQAECALEQPMVGGLRPY